MLLIYFLLIHTANAILLEECKTYDCFVPKKCQNAADTSVDFVPIGKDDEIDAKCPFIIRIYKHDDRYYTIVMESFDPQVSSVELKKDDVSFFKCSKDANKRMKLTAGDSKVNLKEIEALAVSDKVKCFFEATKEDSDIFPSGGYEISHGTKRYFKVLSISERCDPKQLKFEKHVEDQKKYYQSITPSGLDKYTFNIGICRNSIQKLEFRTKSAKEYAPVTSIDCQTGGAYAINTQRLNRNEDIYIRCSSDAQYHCTYSPKPKSNEQPLILTPPDIVQKKIGTLKCPDSHKFLVIGNKKPEPGLSISCVNHNGRMHWTSSNGRILQPSGPEVYCTDRLDCPTISSKAIQSGHLDQKFPKCAQDGVLSIHDGETVYTGDSFDFKCDQNDGKNKFKTSNGSFEIKTDTKFKCTFQNKAEQLNAENRKKIISSAVIPIVVGAVAATLAIVVLSLYIKNRREKNADAFKKASAAQEKAEYDKFLTKEKVDVDDEHGLAITKNMQNKRKDILVHLSHERSDKETVDFTTQSAEIHDKPPQEKLLEVFKTDDEEVKALFGKMEAAKKEFADYATRTKKKKKATTICILQTKEQNDECN